MPNSSPTLYVIATPIGNLGDITLRAIETLKKCDFVICEDSRITGKLLKHLEIQKPFIIYNDHSEQKTREKILNYLLQGKNLALVSDAGTPVISDPGYKLISFLIENNCQILSIPGACSAIAALSICGLPSNQFTFAGFIPPSAGAKEKFLKNLIDVKTTLIFFDSPNRMVKSLEMMLEIFGNKKAAISREITKIYEETKKDDLQNLINITKKTHPKVKL